MRPSFLILLVAAAALAQPLVPREPFAKAHVTMMARALAKGEASARLVDVDLWAEGNRLRAQVRGEPSQFWVDGLQSAPLELLGGRPVEPRKRTLEHGLKLSLAAAPALQHANSDRVAGHPCKIIVEQLAGGYTLTRCIWRGLPLSVQVLAKGFEFNAAATMVEEGAVTDADLQPPPGAPAAPASMSATR